MEKMWTGVTDGKTNKLADDFNSSIRFDKRMYAEDIKGSMAHAVMLGAQKIITDAEAERILDGLQSILNDIETGSLKIGDDAEDIHMFIEQVLTDRIGDTGKKLHTARSRNDQVALDIKLYLKNQVDLLQEELDELLYALCDRAEKYKEAIMPGYTHLQRAQPVTFGHYLMAYAMMLLRDKDRLADCKKRMNVSPIGCCALAGTTYPIDRKKEAAILGFDDVTQNSLDGVSDRDHVVEILSDLSLLMTHLSRLSEELILWSSWEFRFVSLSDEFTTGSSIMPQKKNPDMAELIRGKTGRVYGDLISMLTVLKGLPLAYNKDMQEDKECVFDALDTVHMCLGVLSPMIRTMKANTGNMRNAVSKGFINATDLADYLTKKNVPFRTAYKIAGQIVAKCVEQNETLETLPLDIYREFSDLIEEDVYEDIKPETCVKKRNSLGATCPSSVEKQLLYVRDVLKHKSHKN